VDKQARKAAAVTSAAEEPVNKLRSHRSASQTLSLANPLSSAPLSESLSIKDPLLLVIGPSGTGKISLSLSKHVYSNASLLVVFETRPKYVLIVEIRCSPTSQIPSTSTFLHYSSDNNIPPIVFISILFFDQTYFFCYLLFIVCRMFYCTTSSGLTNGS